MTEVDVQAIRARADDMGSVSLAEVQALCDEVERLRAVIAEIEGVAGRHATGAVARGDSDERRRWLDLMIVTERSGRA